MDCGGEVLNIYKLYDNFYTKRGSPFTTINMINKHTVLSGLLPFSSQGAMDFEGGLHNNIIIIISV